MAAAIISAGAVSAVGEHSDQWPSSEPFISIQDVVASGAAGGVATADDAVSGVSILAIQGGLHVAPGEDELVPGRQRTWLADVRDVIEN